MNWLHKTGATALIGLTAVGFVRAAQCQVVEKAAANWSMIGATPGNSHYSTLKQINRSNVQSLQKAWEFDTGQSGGLETTPIVVDGILFTITPNQQIIALDGATGKPLWKFDSGIKGTQPDRGITYWTDGKDKRLLAGVMNFVYALDPATGKVIPSFGKNGRIDLREDLGREPALQSVALTSPGVLYKDLLIVGGRNPETLPAPPGDIRAYNVRTGALRWSFHTIPHPGEFGYATWPKGAWKISGAANNWAGMAVDVKRGIVYVPTGSAAPDFYGATESVTTSSPTLCSPSTPQLASASGTSRECITTFGIATSPPLRFSSPSHGTEKQFQPLRKLPSRDISTSSIASPARLCFRLQTGRIHPAQLPEKPPLQLSPILCCRNPSRAKSSQKTL